MGHLRGLERSDFVAGAAKLLSGINSLHPYREGNGRAQRAFLGALAAQAGWRIDWSRLDPGRNVAVSIASFRGDDAPMTVMLDELVESVTETLPTSRAATEVGRTTPIPGVHEQKGLSEQP